MNKILATVAGLVSLAMVGSACSAVDNKEATSATPIAVVTQVPVSVYDELRQEKASRSTARPTATVTKVAPKVIKPTVKPKSKVIKPKAKVIKKVIKKKTYKPKVFKKKPYKVKKKVKKYSERGHRPPGGIAACIRKYESGGNYRAQNPHSTASGAYQFINSTWRRLTGRSDRAKDAPKSVQDAAFYKLWNNGKGAGNWVVAHKCGY